MPASISASRRSRASTASRRKPFVGVFAFAINAASPNKDLAIELHRELHPDRREPRDLEQVRPARHARRHLVRRGAGLRPGGHRDLANAAIGVPMPSNPEMGAFWSAMGPALSQHHERHPGREARARRRGQAHPRPVSDTEGRDARSGPSRIRGGDHERHRPARRRRRRRHRSLKWLGRRARAAGQRRRPLRRVDALSARPAAAGGRSSSRWSSPLR